MSIELARRRSLSESVDLQIAPSAPSKDNRTIWKRTNTTLCRGPLCALASSKLQGCCRMLRSLLNSEIFQKCLIISVGNAICSAFVFWDAISFPRTCLVPISYMIVTGLFPNTNGGVINAAFSATVGGGLGILAGLFILRFSSENFSFLVLLVLFSGYFCSLKANKKLSTHSMLANVTLMLLSVDQRGNAPTSYLEAAWSIFASFSVLGPFLAVLTVWIWPRHAARRLLKLEVVRCLDLLRNLSTNVLPVYTFQLRLDPHSSEMKALKKKLQNLHEGITQSLIKQRKLLAQAHFEPDFRHIIPTTSFNKVISIQSELFYSLWALCTSLVPTSLLEPQVWTDWLASSAEVTVKLFASLDANVQSIQQSIEDEKFAPSLELRSQLQEHLASIRLLYHENYRMIRSQADSPSLDSTQAYAMGFMKAAEGLSTIHIIRLSNMLSVLYEQPPLSGVRSWIRLLVLLDPLTAAVRHMWSDLKNLLFLFRSPLAVKKKQKWNPSVILRSVAKHSIGIILIYLPLFFEASSSYLTSNRVVWTFVTFVMIWKDTVEGTVKRLLMRITGTVLGCISGVFIVMVAADNYALFVLWRFACTFVGVYLGSSARWGYTWILFIFTMDVVGLCQVGGTSAPTIIYGVTRAVNTLLGALVALIVAHVFWPMWTSNYVAAEMARVLRLQATLFERLFTGYVAAQNGQVKLDPSVDAIKRKIESATEACKAMLEEADMWNRGLYTVDKKFWKLIRDTENVYAQLHAMSTILRRRPPFGGPAGRYSSMIHDRVMPLLLGNLLDVAQATQSSMRDIAGMIRTPNADWKDPVFMSLLAQMRVSHRSVEERAFARFDQQYFEIRETQREEEKQAGHPLMDINDVHRFHCWMFLVKAIVQRLQIVRSAVEDAQQDQPEDLRVVKDFRNSDVGVELPY